MKPVKGYTLIEVKKETGKGILLHDGSKIDDKVVNLVLATSEKDEVEWKKGGKVMLGEGAKAFKTEEDNIILMPNNHIIGIL